MRLIVDSHGYPSNTLAAPLMLGLTGVVGALLLPPVALFVAGLAGAVGAGVMVAAARRGATLPVPAFSADAG